VKGQLELKIQFKFMQEWDLLFKGVVSFQQRNWKAAIAELSQAIQKVYVVMDTRKGMTHTNYSRSICLSFRTKRIYTTTVRSATRN